MRRAIIATLLPALLAGGCIADTYGETPLDPAIPRKLVIIHTTDSHAKYFPFRLQPNMFDRAMGIVSRYPPCWDLNWSGGSSYCDGAWIAERQRYKFWQGGVHVYLTAEEMAAQGLVSEDVNRDGLCDIADCDILWDRDRDGKCSFPFDSLSGSFLDAEGLPVDPDDTARYQAALARTEDTDRNGICDDRDYHPGLASTGGVARMATIIDRIRQEHAAVPVLYLDSGDAFQGAPQFNLFRGELEMRALQQLGLDAMTIGNHEFDNGVPAFVSAYTGSGGFPLLGANYLFDGRIRNGLAELVEPYQILHRGALRIGIVGIGNESSITSLTQLGNSLGFYGLDPVETATLFVAQIRRNCDVVILLSHQGLEDDFKLAEQVPGVDIILGGHHHVVLDPPKVLTGPDGRPVVVVHSGSDLKVAGELQVIVQSGRVVWHRYRVHPNTDAVPEDATMAAVLRPFADTLRYAQDLDMTVGYAAGMLKRTDTGGGDSPLGNLVTDAMMRHELVRAEIAVTNSLGIRADIPAGNITRGKLYEVFPFENTVSVMYLSGKELKDLFDYVARRSATRGCKTQVQVAGLSVALDCSPDAALKERYNSHALTKELRIGNTVVVADYALILPHAIFKLATNDYMARGGSGFDMLLRNTTRLDTSIPLRDAVIDHLRELGTVDPARFTADDDRRIRMIN